MNGRPVNPITASVVTLIAVAWLVPALLGACQPSATRAERTQPPTVLDSRGDHIGVLCSLAHKHSGAPRTMTQEGLERMLREAGKPGVPTAVKHAVEDFHATKVAGDIPATGRGSLNEIVKQCKAAGWTYGD